MTGPSVKMFHKYLSLRYCLVILHDSTQRHTNLPQHVERLEYCNRVHQIFIDFGYVGLSLTFFLSNLSRDFRLAVKILEWFQYVSDYFRL